MAGSNDRIVQLTLKVDDHWKTGLNQAKRALDQLAPSREALQRTLDLKRANRELVAEIQKLNGEMRTNALAMKAGGAAADSAKSSFESIRGQIILAKTAMAANTLELHRAKGATTGTFAGFIKVAEAMREQGNAADIARQKIANLQRQQAEVSAKIGPLMAAQAASPGISNQQQIDRLISQGRWLKQTIADTHTELWKLSGAQRGSFAAFNATATALEKEALAADLVSENLVQTTGATNAAAAAQERLARATRTATGAMGGQAGVLPNARPMGPLRQDARGEDQEAAVRILGQDLKPWQLTNLAYQANDVVSGLAMGQAPTQVLAQQLGQLLQIFPRFTEMVFSGSTYAFGAMAAAIVLPIARLETLKNSVEFFDQALSVNVDMVAYNSGELATLAQKYDDLGVAVGEARTAIATLAKANVVPERMDEALATARRLAKITGEDLPTAAARLSRAFEGGFEGIRNLDKELNFLTADELGSIRSLFSAGDEGAAQDMAFDALNNSLSQNQGTLGGWSETLREAAGLWNDLVEALSETFVIQAAASSLGVLSKATSGLLMAARDAVDWVSGSMGDTPAERFVNARDAADALAAEIARLTPAAQALASRPADDFSRQYAENNLAELQRQLAEMVALRDQSLAEFTAAGGGTEGGIVDDFGSEEYLKRLDDYKAALSEISFERQREVAALGMSTAAQAAAAAMLEATNLAIEHNLDLTDAQVQAQISSAGQAAAAIELQKQKVEELADAERVAADLVAQQRSEREQVNEVVREGAAAIDLLTQQYGANHPMVRAATAALSSFKAEAAAAENNANRLAYAATNLARALAALGSFDADLNSRLATAQRTIDMAQAGYTENRIRAENQIREQFAAEQAVLSGQVAAGVLSVTEANLVAQVNGVQSPTERIAQLEQVLDLEERAQQIMQDTFSPPSGGGGGGGGGGGSGETPADAAQDITNQILEKRAALIERIETLTANGQTAEADAMRGELEKVNEELVKAIDNAIALYEAQGGVEAQTAILNLRNLRDEIGSLNTAATQFLKTGEDINMSIVDLGVSLIDAAAKGENVFDALRKGLGRFLIELGLAIAKQALFNALTGGGMNLGGGIGGSIAKWTASLFHEGGVVGAGPVLEYRAIDASAFRHAARYHSGGMAGGLRPNEVAAVLERGEEVLTADNPRHIGNGGGRQQVNVKNVNVFDASEMLDRALASEAGQQVLFNFVNQNRRAIGGILGG